ncbi:hypothetical protein U5884_004616 [Vibrio parahaemolyticus]|uniref:hypothetical protein n=1 Tax=Vibrio parahaemolyticus TaxID=670 RepID=UPI0006A599B1|nr:hypothetical protein [Vibrio parahaemolyticus]EGQ8181299.1 hypothetical protein [Vibrio parahaemolyticus]EHD6031754.1 hypothetical protein [Vibrio parahaemolyticus]EJR0958135.1 hypothetical protein [Vibrio parahaemolyticus]EKY4210592.1 hypothetical protein [Vibrio parahaemolyticus]EMA9662494.1 hypothetical protein [Vibrio parahaemolyticus]
MEQLVQIFTLGMWGTKEERDLSKKIKNSYSSLKVVGRGTVFISPEEVHKDLVANDIYEKAKKLVEGN